MKRVQTEVLILGSGISGLSASLSLAEKGIKVLLVTKKSLEISNSATAQGGIASVIDFDHDSFEKHISDTINAGCNLNNPEAVRFFVKNGPESITHFQNLGCRFSENKDGELDLGKEGGHTERRVVHAGDMTGSELIRTVKHAVLSHPEITIFENHTAIDLITTSKFMLSKENKVAGAYILNDKNEVITVTAKSVILATGGCGKVYLYT
jgi:L-aspartate oxidase